MLKCIQVYIDFHYILSNHETHAHVCLDAEKCTVFLSVGGTRYSTCGPITVLLYSVPVQYIRVMKSHVPSYRTVLLHVRIP